ncbi:glutamate-5-semialdehyde dehydrogenase [bacterium]|nr:glutamate-5-semialdehyde dehydrogenase [bacterium]MCP5462648.1 glutamate-5-semialdehyde dehydrogenase [bacterium]
MESSSIKNYILDSAKNARQSALALSCMSTEEKNRALQAMIIHLNSRRTEIQRENKIDLENGRINGLSAAMIDRLTLNDARIDAMIQSLKELILLKDPVGTCLSEWTRPNGMTIKKIRVPIGVIGIIYESRPNVTVDAASLCLKTGNATILRGGKESIHSNRALAKILQDALIEAELPKNAIQLISTTDRQAVGELLQLNEYIDLIIPRGGESLIRRVARESTIPVIKHYKGVCHLYADKELNPKQAVSVILNSKVQRPGVCNALETLLVHESLKETFLKEICIKLIESGVEIRGDDATCRVCPQAISATEDDWFAEYLDMIIAVKTVKNVKDAIAHIEKYGSRHSDGILTTNQTTANIFLQAVDSAVVYHNVSTRFTDGGQFGMGAEIGVSTDKLHARGPMGLEELTSYKYIVTGNGQIRE